ncbi:MAG TPA: MFS transporter [Acidobacteriaceae bacterium]|nr:MFS transporter [Acidobacteriaceae bacterium]
MPQTFRVSLRNRVLLLVTLASGITYLDRVCLSAAAPAIMRDLRLSSIQMGYAFSVFSLAYGIFEIPMGWLGDRLGQRKMITRIVACWSGFTALTGMVGGYVGLLVVRFAFGAAEAGAFPSMAAALARWFRTTDRARATGTMWMGTRLGAAIGIPLATLVMGWFGWRLTFAFFGAIGGIWCTFFWRWYRDNPARHPALDSSDLIYLDQNVDLPSAPETADTPWKRMFTSANLWSFFWMYFASSYGFWFLLTWLPTYLTQRYQVSAQASSLYAALPLVAGAASNVIGGTLSDWLVRRMSSPLWGRRLVGLGGYLMAGLGFAAAGLMQRPFGAVLCLMLADFGMDLAVPVAWAGCLEVGGNFGGTATAFMNTGSTISAFISPLAAAWMFTRFGSFQAMLMSAGAVYLIASLLWLKVDPTRSFDA